MNELTENQKRGLEFFEPLTKEQLWFWASKTDSGLACMELLGQRLAWQEEQRW